MTDEWLTDEQGRRYRMIGPVKEYEPTIRINGVDIPKSELEARPRQAASPVKVAAAPAPFCPFGSGLTNECRVSCALYTVHGCSIGYLVDRAPSVDTQGKSCPFSPYKCRPDCGLYHKGCALTAI